MSTPLRRNTGLADELALTLESRIRDGQLPVGSKLPSEHQLCQEYGISRNVVREAMARLKSNGLVESRQGAGVFVLAADAHQSFRILPGQEDRLALRKLLEFRLELEVAAASMAARRRLPAHLAQWQQLLQADLSLAECEQQLITCLASATGNEYLSDFLRYLNGALAKPVQQAHPWQQDRPGFIQAWQLLWDALKVGDPDLARRQHWRYLMDTAARLGIRGLQGWEQTRMSSLSEPYAPLCAAADANPRPPRFAMPAGACDCHMHVFWPEQQAPFTPHRSYTPPPASLADYRALMQRLGIQRAVVVQPSVYGTDNSVTLATLAAAGHDFRGVVVIRPDTPQAELERMHALGVRGVRLNLLFKSGVAVSDVRTLAAKVAHLGWHLQILTDVSEFPDLAGVLGQLPVPVVIDHLGHMPAEFGPQHPGFISLLRLLESGKLWVKLSGAERLSLEPWPYTDIRPLAEQLLATNPQRLLWASDWPHTCLPGAMPNDGDLLDLLGLWCPDASLRQQILVDNPATLYDFPVISSPKIMKVSP
ncbi:amidohydrolase family protein [Balneatrix alpica]|uniref:Amidohydrolase family protein n=1 Tax=Balneatrix alpica TaxID=75684 RepID=A0ABV5Z869_9GAMM|nr:amidohydrolase family protein [Balneatrix alpica]